MNALVLGGGAARGFAHLGAWKQLEKKNKKIDIITGTSMGALIGAFIADGKSYKEMIDIMEEMSWIKLISSPSKGALMSGDSITKWLKKYFRNKNIEDLEKKFACIATDIDSGEEIVFEKGSIVDAVRASISVPTVFKPHKINKHFCVDGGLLNNLPILQAEKMGAKKIIAVKVQKPKNRKTQYKKFYECHSLWERFFKFRGTTVFRDMLEKTFELMSVVGDQYQIDHAQVPVQVFSFDNTNFGYMDFLKWRNIVKAGEKILK